MWAEAVRSTLTRDLPDRPEPLLLSPPLTWQPRGRTRMMSASLRQDSQTSRDTCPESSRWRKTSRRERGKLPQTEQQNCFRPGEGELDYRKNQDRLPPRDHIAFPPQRQRVHSFQHSLERSAPHANRRDLHGSLSTIRSHCKFPSTVDRFRVRRRCRQDIALQLQI